ncbi:ABC transporter substrate-binding protein [Microlunatus parietis]|uniref:Raffinose/stachyose/melibiose transport system substrate-binding protein n=1 Tax=Microlunatus parietis TaxID=682979 RepID=A0A7Y9I6R6_9ACTN|nr:extracellular solute-binding protein [Microlunatus parietis]NYE71153.1 raffinose/stachyose/melibiose transport system substrate-binding protein [Microlunatus parietis]
MSSTLMATRPRRIGLALASGAAIFSLVACGGGGGTASGGETFDYLAANEGSQIRDEITRLSEKECAAQQEAMPLKIESLPQGDVNQRITLLASQDALPEMFIGSTSELKPGGTIGDDEVTLNLEQKLTELGVIDDVLPAAASTVKNIYGGRFASLPYQFNIEGIFYNRKMFADLGIEEPKTWGDLIAASDKIKNSGKQAVVVSGDQAWTILRWVGNYLFRSIGPNAMKDVGEGKAKLTDPQYVAGIEQVAQLEKYLGPGTATMDIQTATNQLLTGEAGMMYNGSWMLASINDPELNKLGPEAIGFMPFPAVEGGAGSIDQYPANTGAPTALSTKLYNEKVGGWLTCIAEHFGSSAMNNQGVISGFKTNQPVEDVPPLTADIQKIINSTSDTLTWFEQPLGQRAGAAAGESAVPLVTGGMTAAQFAETVQAAVDEDLAKKR